MLIKVFNFLLVASAIQGVLFVVVQVFLKKKIATPILFLNGTVLFISFNNLQAWIIDNRFFSSLYFIKYYEIPWHMLIVPFFYSFLIYYLRIQKKFKSFLRLTLAIFSIETILLAILIVNLYADTVALIVVEKYIQFIEIMNASFSVFIFVKALIIVFRPNNNYNYMLSYDDMKWLKQFLIFGIFVIALWLVGIVLNLYINDNTQRFTYYPMRLSSSILIYWIGYQGLIRFDLTQERISLRKQVSENKIQFERIDIISNDIITDTEKNTFAIIENHIIDHQLFTDSLLSLHSIADELNINKNLISKSINSCSKLNFSDYINKFRVMLAKQMLIDKKYEKYTITSIGLECGFNSKSTFYTSFKKFTSMTPLAYRKENIK